MQPLDCIKIVVAMNPCKCGWHGRPSGHDMKADMFPHRPAYDLFPCTVDIHAIVSTHVETVCLLSNRKADSHIKLSLDMDEYYNIIEKEQAEKK